MLHFVFYVKEIAEYIEEYSQEILNPEDNNQQENKLISL